MQWLDGLILLCWRCDLSHLDWITQKHLSGSFVSKPFCRSLAVVSHREFGCLFTLEECEDLMISIIETLNSENNRFVKSAHSLFNHVVARFKCPRSYGCSFPYATRARSADYPSATPTALYAPTPFHSSVGSNPSWVSKRHSAFSLSNSSVFQSFVWLSSGGPNTTFDLHDVSL